VDVLGDSTPERYAQTLEITLNDPNTDGVLAINCPQGMAEATRTAEQIRNLASGSGKPVLASWMGGPEMTAGIEILNRAGIPTFEFPDTAARVFQYMWNYSYHLRGLYETPVLRTGTQAPDRATVEGILSAARAAGRTLLNEFESKQVLAGYGIPTVKTALAANEEEAVACAARLGYPVALKLHSHTITHKTDVGGVKLKLKTAEEARQAFREIESSVRARAGEGHFLGVTVQSMISAEGYELILGSSVDVQFGPVLLFGTGGQLVEVYQDHALGLPPLTSTLARRMMEQAKIYDALTGVRGRKPVDIPALEELLVRFSELVVEQPWIREIDVNPLLASSEQLLALDARVVLHPAETAVEHLPQTAIRPYPAQYAKPWTMKNGAPVMIRPIRPEDESLLVSFHKALSERTVYLRYFQPLKLSQRVSHERLVRICFQDYDRQIALVVESKDAAGAPIIIAVGRLSKIHGHGEAELAVLVDDRFQHLGLGKELYRRMIEIARAEKLQRVLSTILTENVEMRAICSKLGFALRADLEEDTVQAVLELA
jgi:acetyltransferase